MDDEIRTGTVLPLMSWKEALFQGSGGKKRTGWTTAKCEKGKVMLVMVLGFCDEDRAMEVNLDGVLEAMGWRLTPEAPK